MHLRGTGSDRGMALGPREEIKGAHLPEGRPYSFRERLFEPGTVVDPAYLVQFFEAVDRVDVTNGPAP